MGELFALPTAYSFIFIIILTMANSLVKNDVHLVFHVKQTSRRIREEDLQKLFAYLGGIIRQLKGIAFEIGGRPDHVHFDICTANDGFGGFYTHYQESEQ